MGAEPKKIITENRKARHDYFIDDQIETGIVLAGTEVKSLRLGRVNLKDSYARIKDGEVFVHQMHISPYPFAHYDNHDPLRPRKPPTVRTARAATYPRTASPAGMPTRVAAMAANSTRTSANARPGRCRPKNRDQPAALRSVHEACARVKVRNTASRTAGWPG